MVGICIGDSFSPIDSTQRGCTVKSQLDYEIGWCNPRITKEYILSLKKLGFDCIKLPVTWKDHIVNKPGEFIYEPWLARVKEVVDWCLEEDLKVIINTQHDEEWITATLDHASNIEMLTKIWADIATYFKDTDDRLMIESLSEVGFRTMVPNEETLAVDIVVTKENYDSLYEYQKAFVDTVRSCGGYNETRKLIVIGMFQDLKDTMDSEYMRFPDDDNIAVSCHIYPYDLTISTGCNYTYENRERLKKEAIRYITHYLKKMHNDDRYEYMITEFGMIPSRPKEDIYWYFSTLLELGKKYDIPMFIWDDGTFMNRYTGECRLIDLEKIMKGL